MRAKPKIPRLPLSEVTRAAIGLTKKGKRCSIATKTKISKTLKGRPQAEGTRKALEEWRAKGRPRQDRQGKERQAKAQAQAARAHRRAAQWVVDCRAANELGDGALLIDVLQSKGYAQRRRVHDPTGTVSSGFYAEQDRVVWLHKRVDKTRKK